VVGQVERWTGCPGQELVEVRGRAVDALDVRMDRVYGLGPVDAGTRSAGVRCRNPGERQTLTPELGTDDLDPVPHESDMALHARDDHALEARERCRTPVGSMRTPVIPRRRQTADVPLGAVVVRRHRRVVQEGEQLVAVPLQPIPDPHAVGMTRPGLEHQLVEPIDDPSLSSR
jgi:hypothetical protein